VTIRIYLACIIVMFCAGEPPVCAIGSRYCFAHLMFDLWKGTYATLPTMVYGAYYGDAFGYRAYPMADLTEGLLDPFLGNGLVS